MKCAQLTLARRKIEVRLRDRKRAFRDLQLKLKDCNKFIDNRCNKSKIGKSDLILTMGGVFGYNCGYGVVIKDDLQKLPLPSDGILAKMPSQAVCKCHRIIPKSVTTEQQIMSTPVKFVAQGNNQRVTIQHPITDDMASKMGNNSIGYVLSQKVEKKINKKLGPDFAKRVNVPTSIVAKMYDKFRADVVTLTLLEHLTEQ
eukprot:UN34486